MTPWQILHAGRLSQAALGYRVYHGPGVSVQYCTVASAAPDNSRSFCLSRKKLNLQQLNRRLAAYLKQVQCLETTNKKLEHQIQELLDKKYPKEIKELDRHLKAASVLQDQITQCHSAQARMKLQLLNAELSAFNFTIRCEKERERREHLETELSNLRLQEEELKAHKLPELQSLLKSKAQQLMQLQTQHQQDMQSLLAQMSRGISLEMQTVESSDLIQRLVDLRQNQNECWFNSQMAMLSSPEVSSDSSEEVGQAGLMELRRTAACLEEELTQLHALNILLETSGLEQAESFVLQLVVLQQRAECLCRELDTVLQAAVEHATDYQILLDIKIQLETGIQDYRRLLDELSQEGYIITLAEHSVVIKEISG
ncbi:keratin, type I cytoskeletal 18-like [Anabas testudineus]|uniref:keratin, type I cytoskeletal 18-like n=1 Tax=Anabas testudineus TaxID=64144 RepID=UPI000E457E7C|nr:keratin, type I cytoskeletal 18-like [Anabas testudineus]